MEPLDFVGQAGGGFGCFVMECSEEDFGDTGLSCLFYEQGGVSATSGNYE